MENSVMPSSDGQREIRVIVADDQQLIRDSLVKILGMVPDITVVAAAENGLQACEYAKVLDPDIILMDVKMPVCDGVEGTRLVKAYNPDIKVIILTTFEEDGLVYRLFECGVDGYVLKDISTDKLIEYIRDAVEGTLLIPATIAARLVSRIPKPEGTKTIADHNLSDGEMKVARLIARGCDNADIAFALNLTKGTVKNYASTIYQKLDVGDRTAAVLLLNRLEDGLRDA